MQSSLTSHGSSKSKKKAVGRQRNLGLMITMNENAQWQMIKDSVLFALSSGFSVSLFHLYLKKKSTRGELFCISSFFSLHRSLYLLFAYCLYWRQLRSRDLSFNLFPVGSHVVEHFEVHQYVHTSTINAPLGSELRSVL